MPEINTKSSECKPFMPSVISGIVAGISCAALLNPWDRALYLSVKNKRAFLSFANFSRPYQGVFQAVSQRAFVGSIYFIMQGGVGARMYSYLHKEQALSEVLTQCCIGAVSGSVNALLTNPVSAVKYHTWGQDRLTFFLSVRHMAHKGGWRAFRKGTAATLGRDMTFGSTYEVLRHLLHDTDANPKEAKNNVLYNAIAAGVGTVVSGPFNYARTIHYATPVHEQPQSIWNIMRHLLIESKKHEPSTYERFGFFQRNLCLGWGTLRVAVGVALGQAIFDCCQRTIAQQDKDKKMVSPS